MDQAQRLTTEDMDVVDLLIAQHSLIRDLFDEVKNTRGEAQQDAFHRLRRTLAVHETAEEEVVHPAARTTLEGGHDGLVDDRLAEENEAKKMLGELEGMSPGRPGFSKRLDELRMAVLAHARAEERYEFSHLRDKTDPSTLRAMAASVKAAAGADLRAEQAVPAPSAGHSDGPDHARRGICPRTARAFPADAGGHPRRGAAPERAGDRHAPREVGDDYRVEG